MVLNASQLRADGHADRVTAAQILQSVVNLPVVGSRVNETFSYANTIQTVGGYLPLLATGVALADLAPAWAAAIQERVRPGRDVGARLSSDPRGRSRTSPPATGSTCDRRRRRCRSLRSASTRRPVPRSPASRHGGLGTPAAASGPLTTGHQVVSPANLAQCYVNVLPSEGPLPGGVTSGYGMGWWRDTFPNGLQVVWHTGAFDGFGTTAFLPDHDLGLAAVNAMNPLDDLWTI